MVLRDKAYTQPEILKIAIEGNKNFYSQVDVAEAIKKLKEKTTDSAIQHELAEIIEEIFGDFSEIETERKIKEVHLDFHHDYD